MAVKYDECIRLAGELYGRLLARDSDKEGYDYILEQLSSGQKTLSALVREMATSDEFRERHVMNQSPNELARRLIVNFMGFTRPDPPGSKPWRSAC